MNSGILAIAVTLMTAFAGCVGPGIVEPAAGPQGDAAVQQPSAAAADALQVLTWEGRVAVGGGAEAPAHMRLTEAAVEPIWDSGFNLLVEELPSVVEIRFDWTSSTPSRAMFMAHVADDAEDHRSWVEFEDPPFHANVANWYTEGPRCMRIMTEDLAPGHWHIMAHTAYGTNMALKFTITTVGGIVSIPDGLHGHESDSKEVVETAELYAEKPHAWEPCELSGDDVKA